MTATVITDTELRSQQRIVAVLMDVTDSADDADIDVSSDAS